MYDGFVARGMVRLADISSSNLVCAMDSLGADGEPKDILDPQEISVLENILVANDFDAIPLVSERGAVSGRIARRRYHDGDLFDVFILDVNEVDRFHPDGSILDAIMSVLSNEHHIALVGLDNRIDSILTLDTLAQPNSRRPKIREYLDQKVADVASEHDEGLPAKLSRDIFQGIRDMAELITNDRSGVSDREFTQLAIDVLLRLQPLKQESLTEVDSLSKNPGESWVIRRDDDPIAAEFARCPMIGVLDSGDETVTHLARDSISAANDFSNLLLFSESHDPVGLYRCSEGTWSLEKVVEHNPNQRVDNVIDRLCNLARKGDRSPNMVVRLDDGTHGIITSEELSNPPPLFWLLRRMASLENDLKEWLRGQGVAKVGTLRYTGEVALERASMGEILSHEAFSDLRMPQKYRNSSESIGQLISFRNVLVHEVVAGTASIDLRHLGDALVAERALRKHID